MFANRIEIICRFASWNAHIIEINYIIRFRVDNYLRNLHEREWRSADSRLFFLYFSLLLFLSFSATCSEKSENSKWQRQRVFILLLLVTNVNDCTCIGLHIAMTFRTQCKAVVNSNLIPISPCSIVQKQIFVIALICGKSICKHHEHVAQTNAQHRKICACICRYINCISPALKRQRIQINRQLPHKTENETDELNVKPEKKKLNISYLAMYSVDSFLLIIGEAVRTHRELDRVATSSEVAITSCNWK